MKTLPIRDSRWKSQCRFLAGAVTALMCGSYVVQGAGGLGPGVIGLAAVVLLSLIAVPIGKVSTFHYFDVAVLILLCASIGSYFVGEKSDGATMGTGQFVVLGIVPYFLLRFIGVSRAFLSGFSAGMLLVAIALTAVILAAEIGGVGSFGYRLGSDELNPNGIGLVAGYVSVVGAYHLLTSGMTRVAVFAVFGLAAGGAALALTASRGAFLSTLVAVAILFALTTTSVRLALVLVAGCVVGVVGSMNISVVQKFLDLVGPNSVFFLRVIDLKDVSSISERGQLYQQALSTINDYWFTGLGITGFFEQYGNFPHNLFLDLVVSFGLSGLLVSLLVLIFTVQSFFGGWKYRKHKELGWVYALFVLALVFRQSSLSLVAIKDLLLMAAILVNISIAVVVSQRKSNVGRI